MLEFEVEKNYTLCENDYFKKDTRYWTFLLYVFTQASVEI